MIYVYIYNCFISCILCTLKENYNSHGSSVTRSRCLVGKPEVNTDTLREHGGLRAGPTRRERCGGEDGCLTGLSGVFLRDEASAFFSLDGEHQRRLRVTSDERLTKHVSLLHRSADSPG